MKSTILNLEVCRCQDDGAVFQRGKPCLPILATLHARRGPAPALPGFDCFTIGFMSLFRVQGRSPIWMTVRSTLVADAAPGIACRAHANEAPLHAMPASFAEHVTPPSVRPWLQGSGTGQAVE